jgi:hypothetical protein
MPENTSRFESVSSLQLMRMTLRIPDARTGQGIFSKATFRAMETKYVSLDKLLHDGLYT